ncbi:MAG: hypothetical protein ABI203_04435 [Mucilaginibacter sp.]
MKKNLYLLILILLTATGLHAQVILKGAVYEASNGAKLSDVFVKDMTTRQITLTDKAGKFEIKTESGHLLVFSSPGFVSDTLYVVDLTPVRIELKAMTLSLRGVEITDSRTPFDPRKEYPDVYTKAKVYPLSPSSWFSKEGRDARRLKHYFAHEAEQRTVDKAFNVVYVGSIVPLKGQDLEDFMTLYRPSYSFVISNNSESMAAYINDSYKKFMALPPDKRHLESLPSQ